MDAAPLALRRATTADAAALALVGGATFLESFAGLVEAEDILEHCAREHSAQRYAQWLAAPRARLWVAESPGWPAVVGYLVGDQADLPLPDLGPDDWEIKRVYLLGRFQGRGSGRALMERGIADARELGARRLLLGVYSENAQAISFYRHLGFAVCGTRRFRVGSRERDDLILGISLGT